MWYDEQRDEFCAVMRARGMTVRCGKPYLGAEDLLITAPDGTVIEETSVTFDAWPEMAVKYGMRVKRFLWRGRNVIREARS
jgi:hypothetical protein